MLLHGGRAVLYFGAGVLPLDSRRGVLLQRCGALGPAPPHRMRGLKSGEQRLSTRQCHCLYYSTRTAATYKLKKALRRARTQNKQHPGTTHLSSQPKKTSKHLRAIMPEPVSLPSAPARALAPNATLQPPLSRRGYGPGLVVLDPGHVLAAKPSAEPPSMTLDPPPQYKCAEEGYAVVRISVGGSLCDAPGEAWSITEVGRAIESLLEADECDVKDKFGLLGKLFSSFLG